MIPVFLEFLEIDTLGRASNLISGRSIKLDSLNMYIQYIDQAHNMGSAGSLLERHDEVFACSSN